MPDAPLLGDQVDVHRLIVARHRAGELRTESGRVAGTVYVNVLCGVRERVEAGQVVRARWPRTGRCAAADVEAVGNALFDVDLELDRLAGHDRELT